MHDDTFVLDELEEYVTALETDLAAGVDVTNELPTAPDVTRSSLGHDDVERARELMRRRSGLVERVEGQRVRVAGEIAGLPKRPRPAHRRSPGSFDASF